LIYTAPKSLEISILTTLASTQHGNAPRIQNIGSTSRKPLRSSWWHAIDDDESWKSHIN